MEEKAMLVCLQEQEKKIEELNEIIEHLCDGVYITDGQGKTLRVNRTYEKMAGLRSEELVGKHMKDLVEEGYFSQSASLQVLKLKAPATVMYTVKTGKRLLAKGVPVFDKNGSIKMIVNNVWDVTEIYNLESQTDERRRSHGEDLTDFIFHSAAMDKVVELALKASKVSSNVFILGESGVGKDVIARLIHKASNTKGPFIKVNCAAIPENLLESEFFGYEYGSFTGARKEGKPGMFELAHKGTIFLDEIGELPNHLQAKLLRVIQDKEVTRIGGVKPIAVETRIIAATNRDVDRMVREGKFREDLYYRLHVVPIMIPPLRQRREDVFPLSKYFLNFFNKKYNMKKALSEEALEVMQNYPWPGNVRELENVVERLVVVVDEDLIKQEDIIHFLGITRSGKEKMKLGNLKEAVEALEIQMIRETMKKYETTRRAAQVLGIDQSTLVKKMQRYGMRSKKL